MNRLGICFVKKLSWCTCIWQIFKLDFLETSCKNILFHTFTRGTTFSSVECRINWTRVYLIDIQTWFSQTQFHPFLSTHFFTTRWHSVWERVNLHVQSFIKFRWKNWQNGMSQANDRLWPGLSSEHRIYIARFILFFGETFKFSLSAYTYIHSTSRRRFEQFPRENSLFVRLYFERMPFNWESHTPTQQFVFFD